MTNKEKIAKLYEFLDEADVYGRAIGKIDFDMQTVAPEEGLDRAGEDEAFPRKSTLSSPIPMSSRPLCAGCTTTRRDFQSLRTRS